jgi:F-type H+-transporting ATPase subunit delta
MPGRYATALFELAQEAKSLDQVAGDLDRFSAMLDESEDLTRLVKSPVFAARDQVRALAALFARTGIKGLAASYIGLAARNRRLFAIAEMIAAYRALMAAQRGEIAAEVTSAEKLSAPQVARLKAELKAAAGREVVLTQKVDSAILGGLIVKVGSRMVDSSLATKLNNLKVAMKGA